MEIHKIIDSYGFNRRRIDLWAPSKFRFSYLLSECYLLLALKTWSAGDRSPTAWAFVHLKNKIYRLIDVGNAHSRCGLSHREQFTFLMPSEEV